MRRPRAQFRNDAEPFDFLVYRKRLHQRKLSQLPEVDYFIATSGGHCEAILCKGDACYGTHVTPERRDAGFVAETPYARRTVFAARHEQQAHGIRVKSNHIDDPAVTAKVVRRKAAPHVPDSCCPVRTSRGHESTGAVKHHIEHGLLMPSKSSDATHRWR